MSSLEADSVVFVFALPRFAQRPQQGPSLCFWLCAEQEQVELAETTPMTRALAGPLRISRIPRHARLNRDIAGQRMIDLPMEILS